MIHDKYKNIKVSPISRDKMFKNLGHYTNKHFIEHIKNIKNILDTRYILSSYIEHLIPECVVFTTTDDGWYTYYTPYYQIDKILEYKNTATVNTNDVILYKDLRNVSYHMWDIDANERLLSRSGMYDWLDTVRYDYTDEIYDVVWKISSASYELRFIIDDFIAAYSRLDNDAVNILRNSMTHLSMK